MTSARIAPCAQCGKPATSRSYRISVPVLHPECRPAHKAAWERQYRKARRNTGASGGLMLRNWRTSPVELTGLAAEIADDGASECYRCAMYDTCRAAVMDGEAVRCET